MKKYNLNEIKVGSKITFLKTSKGVVESIMTKCTVGGIDTLDSIRLDIKHSWGSSFHTYRHDGKSTCCYKNDIVSIDGKLLEDK